MRFIARRERFGVLPSDVAKGERTDGDPLLPQQQARRVDAAPPPRDPSLRLRAYGPIRPMVEDAGLLGRLFAR
jgi:hypothetical protein